MNGRGRTSQVIDLIHLQKYRLDDVVADELKPWVPESVHQIFLPPREEIINNNYIVPSVEKLIDKVAADESSSTCDDNPRPLLWDPGRDPANLALIPGILSEGGHLIVIGQAGGVGPGKGGGGGGVGLGWAKTGEGRLEDEECRPDENTDKDEEEPLFFKEVVDGSGEGSVLFEGLGRVR